VSAFVLTGPNGPRVLSRARPRERTLAHAETLITSVDATASELVGTGQRQYIPTELECYLESPPGEVWSRVTLARELGALIRDVETATLAEYGPLKHVLHRARIVTRSPTERGYRLTIRLYSPDHEFTDTDGTPVPLA
jgi:hypothetical protein